MNKYIILLPILAILTGCHKLSDNNATPVNPTNPTSTYDVKFDIADQTVVTQVKHDTLYLTYHEQATLMLNPDDFSNASAVHFKEDFSKANLSSYDYKTLNENNVYSYNSVDDNLNNNAKFITASTVTVSGVKYTKLVLKRDFIFYKAYKLQQLAIEAQTNVLGVSGDKINFSTYYYYNKKNTDPKITTATIVYSKAD